MPMKVIVCFDEVRVTVPCGDGDIPVADLIAKAVHRYKRATGKVGDVSVTVTSLKTISGGGILDPDDLLNDVVDDREQLIADFDEPGRVRRETSTSPSPSSLTPSPHHHPPPLHAPYHLHNGGDAGTASGSSCSTGALSPELFQSVATVGDTVISSNIGIGNNVISIPPFLPTRRHHHNSSSSASSSTNTTTNTSSLAATTDVVVVTPRDLTLGSNLRVRRGSDPGLNLLDSLVREASSNKPVAPNRPSITRRESVRESDDPKSESSEDEKRMKMAAYGSLDRKRFSHKFTRDITRASLSNRPEVARWMDAQERRLEVAALKKVEAKQEFEDKEDKAELNDESGQVITIQNDGGPLGIHAVPAYDGHGRPRGLLIQSVEPGRPVDRDGRMGPNDVVVAINGMDLDHVPFLKAQDIFRSAMQSREINLRIVKGRQPVLSSPTSPASPTSSSSNEQQQQATSTSISAVSKSKRQAPPPPVLPKPRHHLPSKPSPLTLPSSSPSTPPSHTLGSNPSATTTNSSSIPLDNYSSSSEFHHHNNNDDNDDDDDNINDAMSLQLSRQQKQQQNHHQLQIQDLSQSANPHHPHRNHHHHQSQNSSSSSCSSSTHHHPPTNTHTDSRHNQPNGLTSIPAGVNNVIKPGPPIRPPKKTPAPAIPSRNPKTSLTIAATTTPSPTPTPTPPPTSSSSSHTAEASININALTNTRRIGKCIAIQLKKGPLGLGFSVTSRDNQTDGECPIYIRNILPKGAAIQDGRLRIGDRLLEVNGVEMTGKNQAEAVTLLRMLSEGSLVDLVVSRQEEVDDRFKVPRPLERSISGNEVAASSWKAGGNERCIDGTGAGGDSGGGGSSSNKSEVEPKTTILDNNNTIDKAPPPPPLPPNRLLSSSSSLSPSSPSYSSQQTSFKGSSSVSGMGGNDDLDSPPGFTKEKITLRIPLNDTGSAGLGVSVKGKTRRARESAEVEDLGIFIKTVLQGGAASKDGRLQVNDQLLEVNDFNLVGLANTASMDALRSAMLDDNHDGGYITLSVARYSGGGGGAVSPSLFAFGDSGNSDVTDSAHSTKHAYNGPGVFHRHQRSSSSNDSSSTHGGGHPLPAFGENAENAMPSPIPPVRAKRVGQLRDKFNDLSNAIRNESYSKATHESLNDSNSFTNVMPPSPDKAGKFFNQPPKQKNSMRENEDDDKDVYAVSSKMQRPHSTIGFLHGPKISQSSVSDDEAFQRASTASSKDDSDLSPIGDPLNPFAREGFGRQSMSEKRKGHVDPRSTEVYKQAKANKENNKGGFLNRRVRSFHVTGTQAAHSKSVSPRPGRKSNEGQGHLPTTKTGQPAVASSSNVHDSTYNPSSQAGHTEAFQMKRASSVENLTRDANNQSPSKPQHPNNTATSTTNRDPHQAGLESSSQSSSSAWQTANRFGRARACNDSFRAAVDRSYDIMEPNPMDTLEEESLENSAFNLDPSFSGRSSLSSEDTNSLKRQKGRDKDKDKKGGGGLLKGFLRFGKGRKSNEEALRRSRSEERSAHKNTNSNNNQQTSRRGDHSMDRNTGSLTKGNNSDLHGFYPVMMDAVQPNPAPFQQHNPRAGRRASQQDSERIEEEYARLRDHHVAEQRLRSQSVDPSTGRSAGISIGGGGPVVYPDRSSPFQPYAGVQQQQQHQQQQQQDPRLFHPAALAQSNSSNYPHQRQSSQDSTDSRASIKQAVLSRAEKIQQLRTMYQQKHRQNQGVYPLDDTEEQYEQQIKQMEQKWTSPGSVHPDSGRHGMESPVFLERNGRNGRSHSSSRSYGSSSSMTHNNNMATSSSSAVATTAFTSHHHHPQQHHLHRTHSHSSNNSNNNSQNQQHHPYRQQQQQQQQQQPRSRPQSRGASSAVTGGGGGMSSTSSYPREGAGEGGGSWSYYHHDDSNAPTPHSGDYNSQQQHYHQHHHPHQQQHQSSSSYFPSQLQHQHHHQPPHHPTTTTPQHYHSLPHHHHHQQHPQVSSSPRVNTSSSQEEITSFSGYYDDDDDSRYHHQQQQQHHQHQQQHHHIPTSYSDSHRTGGYNSGGSGGSSGGSNPINIPQTQQQQQHRYGTSPTPQFLSSSLAYPPNHHHHSPHSHPYNPHHSSTSSHPDPAKV